MVCFIVVDTHICKSDVGKAIRSSSLSRRLIVCFLFICITGIDYTCYSLGMSEWSFPYGWYCCSLTSTSFLFSLIDYDRQEEQKKDDSSYVQRKRLRIPGDVIKKRMMKYTRI